MAVVDKVVPVLVGKRTEIFAGLATLLVLAEAFGVIPAGGLDQAAEKTSVVSAALAAVFAAARAQR